LTTWNLSQTRHHLLICNGGSCMRKGGEEVTQAIRDEISRLGVDQEIHTTRTRCNGRCEDSCVVIVYPEGVWYKHMTPEIGREMVRRHLVGGELVKPLVTYRYQDDHFEPAEKTVMGESK
jgi:(2Fe-2S) ferredoxin